MAGFEGNLIPFKRDPYKMNSEPQCYGYYCIINFNFAKTNMWDYIFFVSLHPILNAKVDCSTYQNAIFDFFFFALKYRVLAFDGCFRWILSNVRDTSTITKEKLRIRETIQSNKRGVFQRPFILIIFSLFSKQKKKNEG